MKCRKLNNNWNCKQKQIHLHDVQNWNAIRRSFDDRTHIYAAKANTTKTTERRSPAVAGGRESPNLSMQYNSMSIVSILNVVKNFINFLTFVEQCIFYLFNLNFSLIQQFHQFLHKKTEKSIWKIILKTEKKKNDNRFQRLFNRKTVICFYFRWALFFDFVQNFQFHCQNVHCVATQLLHRTSFCIYMIIFCWRSVARMRLRKKYDSKKKAWNAIIFYL